MYLLVTVVQMVPCAGLTVASPFLVHIGVHEVNTIDKERKGARRVVSDGRFGIILSSPAVDSDEGSFVHVIVFYIYSVKSDTIRAKEGSITRDDPEVGAIISWERTELVVFSKGLSGGVSPHVIHLHFHNSLSHRHRFTIKFVWVYRILVRKYCLHQFNDPCLHEL